MALSPAAERMRHEHELPFHIGDDAAASTHFAPCHPRASRSRRCLISANTTMNFALANTHDDDGVTADIIYFRLHTAY